MHVPSPHAHQTHLFIHLILGYLPLWWFTRRQEGAVYFQLPWASTKGWDYSACDPLELPDLSPRGLVKFHPRREVQILLLHQP